MKNKQHTHKNILQLGVLPLIIFLFQLTGCYNSVPHHHGMKTEATAPRIQEAPKVQTKATTRPTTNANEINNCDYELIKTAPDLVAIGQRTHFNYKVHAKNKIRDIVLHDRIPKGMEYISSQPAATVDGRNLTWKLGWLNPDDTTEVDLYLKPVEKGLATSCAWITAVPLACSKTLVGQPMIDIEKSGPAQARLGQTVDFNIIVSNQGDLPATDVMVVDTIPSGLSHPDGPTIEYPVGKLDPGESRKITLPLTATQRGKFINTAKVTSSNAGSESDTAPITILQPSLKITKKGPAEAFIRKNADYSIAVKNTGDSALTNLVVSDTALTPLKILSAKGATINGNTAVWKIKQLKPGQTQHFDLTATSEQSGTYRNTARVVASDKVDDQTAVSTLWKGYPALLIEMLDSKDPLNIGEVTTYTISVTNQGTAADHDIKIRAELSPKLQLVQTDGSTPSQVEGNNVTFAPIANLKPKQTVSWLIKCRAKTIGDARLNVFMTSELLQKAVREEEATQIY